MANCISLAMNSLLILRVSSLNELSDSHNTWTQISGDWSYDEGKNWIELKQSYSSTNHAEISILDTEWYNGDAPLSINYTYAIDFRDKTDQRSSGVILYNGKAGSYCEHYYFGIESAEDDYYVFIWRGTANSDEPEGTYLVREPLQFAYGNDNDYTLSITVHNGNTFKIWIDRIHHISFTDESAYTTQDNGNSGYISIWSSKRIKVTARDLEISGAPTRVSPIDHENCVTLSPTSQDPTEAPTAHPTDVPTPFTLASSTPSSGGGFDPTLSIHSTASIHRETRANDMIVSGNVLIVCSIGAGLLLLCVLICVISVICTKCRLKDEPKKPRGVPVGIEAVAERSVTPRMGKTNTEEPSGEEPMLQMAGNESNNAYEHVVRVDEDSDSMEQTIVAAAAGLPIPHDHDSSDEEYILPSGNVTCTRGGRSVPKAENESDEGGAAIVPPSIPRVPEDSEDENVPPAPLPPNQDDQEKDATISGAFMTKRRSGE